MVDVDITWLIDKLLWELQLSPLMAFQLLAIIYQNYVDYPRPSQPTSLQETAGPSGACLQVIYYQDFGSAPHSLLRL